MRQDTLYQENTLLRYFKKIKDEQVNYMSIMAGSSVVLLGAAWATESVGRAALYAGLSAICGISSAGSLGKIWAASSQIKSLEEEIEKATQKRDPHNQP